jgi:hypothetical protein
MKHEYPLKFVLEALSPEYIEILKNMEFDRIPMKKGNRILKTKIDDGNAILIKKIRISDFSIYILLYLAENQLESASFRKNLDEFSENFADLYKKFLF